MSHAIPQLSAAKRIVIKTGSALVADEVSGEAKRAWMTSLMDDIAQLKAAGAKVILVSSGAVALGRGVLGLQGKDQLQMEEKQAAAATGQVALMDVWGEAASKHGMKVAQILLTLDISEQRSRYLNARNTIETLLEMDVLPIVNENDTIATAEIKVGDNDRLAARVAEMSGADVLVIFSNIDGFYTADPSVDPDAKKMDVVDTITPEIEAMAGKSRSNLASGGMITKLIAAKLAQQAGCHTLIANGTQEHPLKAAGESGTWITSDASPATARKLWIAGSLSPAGKITVDDGAATALSNGKSLLAAGVSAVEGDFQKGEAIQILSTAGDVLGKGLAAYHASEMQQIMGKKSEDFESILGYKGKSTVVHRDDMVLAK